MQLSVLRIHLQFLLLFVVFQQVPTAIPSRKKNKKRCQSEDLNGIENSIFRLVSKFFKRAPHQKFRI